MHLSPMLADGGYGLIALMMGLVMSFACFVLGGFLRLSGDPGHRKTGKRVMIGGILVLLAAILLAPAIARYL